jgi:uncharacterized membrane protein YidH (DUF202 family)
VWREGVQLTSFVFTTLSPKIVHTRIMSSTKNRLQTEAEAHVQRSKPWLERLARLGFLAKGLVYITVGGLALQAALGSGGQTTDTQGAVGVLAQQPFGQALLVLLSLGLISYGLWRFVQAATNPANRKGAKGVAARTGLMISGIIHLALAVTALQLLIGTGSSAGNTEQDVTARLLMVPFGRWLVGILGLIVVGVGMYQLAKAYRSDFKKALKVAEMSSQTQTWAVRAGRMGYTARGIVFGLTGVFFIRAALQAEASEARGLGGALSALQRLPYGPYVLGGVALGLILFGLYMAVEARYRDIYAE